MLPHSFGQYCHGWAILVRSFIFVNNLGFSYIIPMVSKSQAGIALTEYFENKDFPTVMHMDGTKEFLARMLGWQKILSHHGGIKQSFAEPNSHWQYHAEAGI